MAERRHLEFFLLRYVPDAVKGEFVNFGVMAMQNGSDGSELIDVRLTKDWGRVECLDPEADVELLEALGKELRAEIGQKSDQTTLRKRMEDSFSGVVQVSAVMPTLTEQLPEVETDIVARTLLETVEVKTTREPVGRRKILQTMREEFENAGVLKLLHAVPVESYTKAGDPLKFDFGYRFGNEIKLFHAVSMRASIDAAVTLAARYPKIMPAMAQVTAAAPMLTAVVEDDLDRTRSEVGFALEMMEESRVRVARTGEMAEIARVAKVELRA